MIPLNKTKRNLWIAFMDEAKANRLYIAYAQKAREEGHEEIAKLFEEIAEVETSHALSHLKALKEVKSTHENLKGVVELEAEEAQSVFPHLLEEVRKEGNSEAIQSMEKALNEGKKHLEQFSRALRELEKKLGISLSPLRNLEPRTLNLEPQSQPEVGIEKSRIAKLERIREIVFGMQDGVVSTVAIASSMMVATHQTFPTLLAGLASALAGTISMSSGTFLASKSEKELHQAELEKEEQELIQKPEEETAELVEMYRQEGFSHEEAIKLTERIGKDPELWLKTLAEKELGLHPEMAYAENPWKDAVTMGISFLAGSLATIAPYLFLTGMPSVWASMGVSLILLFGIGAIKTTVTRRNPWLSGLEVMGIGAFSALFGYLLGNLLPYLFPSVKGWLPI